MTDITDRIWLCGEPIKETGYEAAILEAKDDAIISSVLRQNYLNQLKSEDKQEEDGPYQHFKDLSVILHLLSSKFSYITFNDGPQMHYPRNETLEQELAKMDLNFERYFLSGEAGTRRERVTYRVHDDKLTKGNLVNLLDHKSVYIASIWNNYQIPVPFSRDFLAAIGVNQRTTAYLKVLQTSLHQPILKKLFKIEFKCDEYVKSKT